MKKKINNIINWPLGEPANPRKPISSCWVVSVDMRRTQQLWILSPHIPRRCHMGEGNEPGFGDLVWIQFPPLTSTPWIFFFTTFTTNAFNQDYIYYSFMYLNSLQHGIFSNLLFSLNISFWDLPVSICVDFISFISVEYSITWLKKNMCVCVAHHSSFPLTTHLAQVPKETRTRMCTTALLKQ